MEPLRIGPYRPGAEDHNREGTGFFHQEELGVLLAACVCVDNAPVSAEMLKTIFTPYTPLHDGAVIINGGNILTAGAILPLTQLPVRDKSLGTRHRAALGLSEETDATVVVVSEETSRISVARGGRIEVGIDENRLREILTGPISPERKGAK